MSDLPTRLSLERKLQGKELPKALRNVINKSAGRRLDNLSAKKELIKTLAYKSEYGRENILRKMGLKYEDRGKLKTIISNQAGLSEGELKKRQLKIKRYNIAQSVAAADKAYNETTGSSGKSGLSFSSGNTKNRMSTINDNNTHGASIRSYSSINTVARKNLNNPMSNPNANKLTGGPIRPMGIGRL